MGTVISLALGRLEVDWGKNNFFNHHGALYQETDLTTISLDCDTDGQEDDTLEQFEEEAYSKPLSQVIGRLELMGHTVRAAEHNYWELHSLHGLSDQPIPFSELSQALIEVDVTKVSGKYGGDYGPGEFVREEILARLKLASWKNHDSPSDFRPDHWEVDLLLENFGAYSALRLLAENPKNHELDVTWGFGPLVESGWADRHVFKAGPSPDQVFLIVGYSGSFRPPIPAQSGH